MRKQLRRSVRLHLTVAFLVAILLPLNLMAWGPEGHIVIAKIAAARLSPSAKTGVKQFAGPAHAGLGRELG